jgi:Ca2+/Na+ antiporter
LLAACACAWRLAGAAAAVVVGVLLALDPLLLGHAPLVKNDAAITLVTLALAAAVVSAMRGSAWSLLALVLCSAVAVIVKFSASCWSGWRSSH